MNVYFVSLGCDKNLVDSEDMLGILDAGGYTVTDDEDNADIIIVNTCCFIEDAKKESINTILEMADNPKIHKHRVAIRAIGKIEALPENVRKAIDYAYEKTKDYDQFTISICLAYGGRQEIVEAVKEIAAKIEAGDMAVEEITEKVISSHLYTGDMPDPDLILRTSGEIRVSNFLLWQLAYSELYFTDIYWPGFRRIDLLRAIRSYQQRKRRYGE